MVIFFSYLFLLFGRGEGGWREWRGALELAYGGRRVILTLLMELSTFPSPSGFALLKIKDGDRMHEIFFVDI